MSEIQEDRLLSGRTTYETPPRLGSVNSLLWKAAWRGPKRSEAGSGPRKHERLVDGPIQVAPSDPPGAGASGVNDVPWSAVPLRRTATGPGPLRLAGLVRGNRGERLCHPTSRS